MITIYIHCTSKNMFFLSINVNTRLFDKLLWIYISFRSISLMTLPRGLYIIIGFRFRSMWWSHTVVTTMFLATGRKRSTWTRRRQTTVDGTVISNAAYSVYVYLLLLKYANELVMIAATGGCSVCYHLYHTQIFMSMVAARIATNRDYVVAIIIIN